eukprot:GHVN01083976.1.p1 GENE.GHVN01083976.1~~GHVN01083976.1.p1  ORF type:complete len:192 (-),score=33.62 GHVN01083976.1:213-788(-)
MAAPGNWRRDRRDPVHLADVAPHGNSESSSPSSSSGSGDAAQPLNDGNRPGEQPSGELPPPAQFYVRKDQRRPHIPTPPPEGGGVNQSDSYAPSFSGFGAESFGSGLSGLNSGIDAQYSGGSSLALTRRNTRMSYASSHSPSHSGSTDSVSPGLPHSVAPTAPLSLRPHPPENDEPLPPHIRALFQKNRQY